MCRAVLAPVVRMTGSPICLGTSLVVAVVGIIAKTLPLPSSPAFVLTFGGGTVPLSGGLGTLLERTTARDASPDRIHECAPCNF
jgi:hypothetical protein